MKGKTKTKTCHIIDMTKAPYTTFGLGVKKGNPRKCLACGQPIKRGETWRRDAGPEDPKSKERIVTIHHSPRCPGQKARNVLQKMLAKAAIG